MNKNGNASLALLIILVVILVGGAAYYAGTMRARTPEEALDNKTNDVVAGADPYASAAYVNRKYGFYFETLPAGWSGYREEETAWSGYRVEDEAQTELVTGTTVTLKDLRVNPPQESWQDIPIMIYALRDWEKGMIQQAAPVAPAELGRNNKYAFILPARAIGFRDTLGVQEVSEWFRSNPLRTFDL